MKEAGIDVLESQSGDIQLMAHEHAEAERSSIETTQLEAELRTELNKLAWGQRRGPDPDRDPDREEKALVSALDKIFGVEAPTLTLTMS